MRLSAKGLHVLVALLVATSGCGDDSTGPEAPAAPTGLTVTAMSATSVQVTWQAVSGAQSYELDRAAGTGSFSTIQSNLTGTSYNDTGLTGSTQYRYQVRAVGGGGGKSASSSEAVVTTPNGRVATLTVLPSSRTLFADTTYVLSGYVKVSNGSTLTIQAGTKIVGDTLVPGSALFVLRGSKIVANGTATAPIVFTSQREAPNRRPGDWGGIVIVGSAPINRNLDLIFTEGASGSAENYAGGTAFNDNSGSMRYVRIEFAGYDVSNGAGQELNSLSMYAVGRATTFEYIESMAGLDDSFEWFGGAPDSRYLMSFESGDDHFDWSEGYQGRAQFLIGVQTDVIQPRTGTGTVSADPRGFEGDGCELDKGGCTYANLPYSAPVFANFTLVGPGTGVFTTTDGGGAVIRRGSGGTFVNGIIARWPGVGVSIRDTESGTLLTADTTHFRNVVLVENGSNYEAVASGRFGDRLQTNAAAWSISTATAAATFAGALPTRTTTVTAANLNVVPAGSAATGGLATFTALLTARTASFFGAAMTGTAYLGGVAPTGAPWYSGWTNFQRN